VRKLQIMTKKAFCLTTGLVSTFTTSFTSTQIVCAKGPKDDLYKKCIENIIAYWIGQKHITKGTLIQIRKFMGENRRKELGQVLTELCAPEHLEKYVKTLFNMKEYTLPILFQDLSEVYECSTLSMSPLMGADCRTMSCYVLLFLRKIGVEKSYMMAFRDENLRFRDAVIYAIEEKGEENWYVCDMEAANSLALLEYIREGLDKDITNNDLIKKNIMFPLIDYVKERVKNDPVCLVFDDTKGEQIIGEDGYTDEYWLLGEFINLMCKKEYQNKFFIRNLTENERNLLNESILNFDKISDAPFRIFERQRDSKKNSLLRFYDDKSDFNFVIGCGCGKLYSLKDEASNKDYENVLFVPKMSN